jgi:uncharacterized protein (DUF924 family)
MTPGELIDFWFSEPSRQHWFRSTPQHDRDIRSRFERLWEQARDGQLVHWEQSATGALALVILLDQLPLNMFRERPPGFSSEAQAREVADRAIARGFAAALTEEQKSFLYMPFMHSESPADQDRSVSLYAAAGLDDSLKWARHHREIIPRFGRFPHRNAILGRESTAEERQWLDSPEGYRP